MYLNCRICQRVTDHKKDESQASTHVFPNAGVVQLGVFYICPHCNTGVAGNSTMIQSNGKIESKFEQGLNTR